jgi:hypothetical protein
MLVEAPREIATNWLTRRISGSDGGYVFSKDDGKPEDQMPVDVAKRQSEMSTDQMLARRRTNGESRVLGCQW